MLMVRKNIAGINHRLQLGIPFLACSDNGHMFLVINFIIILSSRMFFTKLGEGVENIIVIIL
jgi:hypothetical protein